MTVAVVCCDGLAPAYLEAVGTPAWDAVADAGAGGTCEGVVPSLTNVNTVSIAAGAYPEAHGITGNTYYDSERGERAYMEDPSYLRRGTRLERAAEDGERTAALVGKEKLRRLVGRGCDVAASAESPPAWLADAVGPAPDIYSGAASGWVLDAAVHLLAARDPDVLFVATTDVVPHKHAPDEPEAREWVRTLDAGIDALRERVDGLAATADHGMRRKTRRVDLEAALPDATVVRLIRDRHTYHHRNLGGAAYVHAANEAAAADRLADFDGVEAAIPRAKAAERFRLPPDRIGDLLVLGDSETVFGPVEEGITGDVDLRSHGSAHERTVPYASTGGPMAASVEAFDSLS